MTAPRNPQVPADARPRPAIGMLLGDPSGIGPEMAVRLLSRPEVQRDAQLVIIGDRAVLEAGERVAGGQIDPVPVGSLGDAARVPPGRIAMMALDAISADAIGPSRMTEASARYALQGLEAAARGVAEGHLHGVAFAPLNKGTMRLAGLTHEDELRLLQSLLNV